MNCKRVFSAGRRDKVMKNDPSAVKAKCKANVKCRASLALGLSVCLCVCVGVSAGLMGEPLRDQGPKTNRKLNFKAHCVRIMWPMLERAMAKAKAKAKGTTTSGRAGGSRGSPSRHLQASSVRQSVMCRVSPLCTQPH